VIPDSRNNIEESKDSNRDVLRHLVEEAGLTDEVLVAVVGDAETHVICEQGRAEVRSLTKLAGRVVWRLPRETREVLPVTVQEFVNN